MPRHQLETFAGQYTASVYSGAVVPAVNSNVSGLMATVGSDVQFVSGPGRLATVFVHTNTSQSLSGVAINFYDGFPVSGGPIVSSGHVLLLTLNGPLGLSGQIGLSTGLPVVIGSPFINGLCYNSRSGQTGITVTFSQDRP